MKNKANRGDFMLFIKIIFFIFLIFTLGFSMGLNWNLNNSSQESALDNSSQEQTQNIENVDNSNSTTTKLDTPISEPTVNDNLGDLNNLGDVNNAGNMDADINAENKSNTTTSGTATLKADPITWSISQDGPITSLITNPRGIHVENGQAWLIGGLGYDYLPEGPGVYTRTWECSEGLTVTQQITITE